MKKIDTSLIVDPNTQQPFSGPSLSFLQDAEMEGFYNIIIGMIEAAGLTFDPTKVYILWGCELTGVSTGSGPYSVDQGAVFFAGEFYMVDGVSGTLSSQTLYSAVATTYAPFDPVTFSDSSTHSVHEIRKWVVTPGSSGSNAYSTWIRPFVHEIPIAVGSGGSAPAFGSGFAAPGASDELLFWKDTEGNINIEGLFHCTNTASTLIFTLPVGYRPKVNTGIGFILTDVSTLTPPAFGFVLSNGQVYATFSATDIFCISRIMFLPA